ncbi:hypothetical protein QYS48_13215 [Marivirga arenosa]|uniref:Copper-binding protein MbnP-like domain-containing protein n=1 Tax=Marivirga arenosa TaxID=3059076 RepID=A0AA49GJJ9_9BACT|nr:MbnP family protein [Marivirga sp. ABR2-2]WKK87574.1 hypothetical protein QYS48_13215 [Marivirga sp. ABR2-2]
MKNLYILLIASILMFSCNDDMNENIIQEDVSFNFHFHPTVGDQEFSTDQVYSINNHEVVFSTVSFYVSNLSLQQKDGQKVALDNATEEKEDDLFLLVSADKMIYEGVTVPGGEYGNISFQIGVDTLVNSTIEPSAWPSDHALSEDYPGFAYWSWNSGYKFIVAEGTVDGEAFKYHIGTNALIKDINLSADFMLLEDGNEIMISYDIAEFFSGIDLGNPDNLVNMTFKNPEQANKIADNVSKSVKIMGNQSM